MNENLLRSIQPVVDRFRQRRLWRLLTLIAMAAAVVSWLSLRRAHAGLLLGPQTALMIASVTLSLVLAAWCFVRFSFHDTRHIATQIEAKFPTLKQRLLTALSQTPDTTDAGAGQLGYLQQRVIGEAESHAKTHPWTEVVPSGQLMISRLTGLTATAALLAVLMLLALADPQSYPATSLRPVPDMQALTVQPGDAVIERGSGLVVTARFADEAPEEADLICIAADGSQRRIRMTRNLDDPVVGAFLSSINEEFTYRVDAPDRQSESYQVQVFDYPSLVRSDAQLDYPEYTEMTDRRVEDTVRVSAVVGTQLKWICYLNKEVVSAELVAEDGTREPLQMDAENPGVMSAAINLQQSRRWTLELVDAENRKNEYPPELVARVLPNAPPTVKLLSARDLRVSPLEELPLAAEVHDDFGVARAGLTYSFAGADEEIVLAESQGPGEKQTLEKLVSFESLDAKPDQLLSYYFWAEDQGPDGELRRTESDMFFAEVRPFEEIFRQGTPPPGGQQQQQQSQSGQQAEELAKLQKEIINATWTVIRRETGDDLSDAFATDVKLIKESQQTALAQLQELAQQVSDRQSVEFVQAAELLMLSTIEQLSAAHDDLSLSSLQTALKSEQASYQALLKLRAREFQVTRQQQQQSSGQSASNQQRQQQLDDLELDNQENRYETQQQAQPQAENQQARDVRQVLNRLRDLARRQEDLNDQLAQLQSALEQAETPEEREEIQRQLKRLRDQQQDMLRETDELAQRMQSPENQQQMQQSSEQLSETRENVRRATEALEQNDVSQALTAGTRAEREFEEMRDEFRQKAAGEFTDAMRQMRREAHQLDEKQQQIAQQMQDEDTPDAAGLRAGDDHEQLEQAIQSQREKLDQLLQQMQETVEQAEPSEPLLAQNLYDSFRNTQQQQIDQRLDETSQLLQHGFESEAGKSEQAAREGIGQLREELEQAAQSVLGDETEALRRALSELEQLTRELDQEIRRADPQAAGQNDDRAQPGNPAQTDSPSQPGSPSRPSSPSQSGGPAEQQDSAESQPGSGQPSQREQQAGQATEPAEPTDQASPQQGQPGQQGQPAQSGQPGQQPADSNPDQQSPSGQQPSANQSPGARGGQGTDAPPRPSPSGQGQSGSPQSGQPQSDQVTPGQAQSQQPGQPSRGGFGGGENQGGFLEQSGWAAERPAGDPLTGEGFREWSDRLRDVEEMVGDPQLRSQASQIRDRAREVRRDLRRHSKSPQWPVVQEMIAEPLRELKRDVAEELMRRSAEKNANVPIDRDPVPERFSSAVQRYYENLGSGR